MASANPFDLLGDDDNDDPSQLIAKKAALAPTSVPPPQQQQPKATAKMPSKPVAPSQAVREAKGEGRGAGRGGGGGRGSIRGRGPSSGGTGYNRERVNNENSFGNNGMMSGGYAPTTEDGDVDKSERRGGYGAPRGSFRGGRRGGFNNGEADGERPRRVFERHSGTGRGRNEIKREGSGKGNWGSTTDEIAPETEEQGIVAEKSVTPEKQLGEEDTADASKENPEKEPEEKEPEEKEMTLDEYQKILEEKRKALLALKVEERKVTVDKEFESMQQLSGKKNNDEIFAKLGSDKDKKKEIADKEEKAKKAVSINEFLKPAGGEKYYSPGGRGRGRGGRGGARGGGSGFGGGGGGGSKNVEAPSIEDPGEFPNLLKKA